MNVVWGCTYAGDYRTVDGRILQLREKLERNPAGPGPHHDQMGGGVLFQRIGRGYGTAWELSSA